MLNAILGFIVGLPIVGATDLGLILAIGFVVAFSIIEQRVLAAGEGWDWRLIVPYLAGWGLAFVLFGRGP